MSRSGPATGAACSTRWVGRSARRRLSIRSAHIATLAGQAIDTFYVTEADGQPPSPDRVDEAERILADAARGVTIVGD